MSEPAERSGVRPATIMRALEPLVREEVSVLLERLEGEERAADIVAAGAEPLHELIGAMHSKLLLEESARRRDGDAAAHRGSSQRA